jgi:hypothetical protein
VQPDAPPSRHIEEFRLRVLQAREKGLDGLWDVALDLGGQVSLIRHEMVEIVQSGEVRDARLFGIELPDGRHAGGALPEIQAALDRVEKSTTKRAVDRRKMFDSWWARIPSAIVALAAIYDIIHSALK